MIARFLSIAAPLAAILTFTLVVWGVYRRRSRIGRPVLLIACIAFAGALFLRPFEHMLFFDEDIYIQIATNLQHAPISQLILLGGPDEIIASTYYKEPAGFPTQLGLVLLVTGTSEQVAFILARVFFALAVAAVYLLALEFLKHQEQAITAAVVFAGAPAFVSSCCSMRWRSGTPEASN